MLVTITRDCQIDGTFYHDWSEIEIDQDLFQSDCMNEIPSPENTENFDQSLEDPEYPEDWKNEEVLNQEKLDEELIDEETKPPSKKKK